MSNDYYQYWTTTPQDYPRNLSLSERLKFILKYGLIAPNSHNTQPWKFAVGPNYIDIFPDLNRTLAYSDRAHRELYISLGCALANLLIAGTKFGLHPQVSLFPEDTLDPTAVRLTFSRKSSPPIPVDLFPFLTTRRTNRGAFKSKPITDSTAKLLLDYNDEPEITVHLVTDRPAINQIADIMYEAATFAFTDRIFKQELSRWVRPNNTSRPDGMPLSGFGMPFVISLFASQLIRHMPAPIQAKMDKAWVLSSSAMVIISGSVDDKQHWISAGKVYEYFALAAAKIGLATAPMAAIIEHPPSNRKVKDLLKTTDKLLFYARLGYPLSPYPHSPRRTVSDILV